LQLIDIRGAATELQAIELRTSDEDLRIYLRLAIGLLRSPIIQDTGQRLLRWSPEKSPSIKPLIDYCRKQQRS
jgi:hypothetical protein